jgi:hypothetical protein
MHFEELHYLLLTRVHCSGSRKVQWVEHVAYMEGREMLTRFGDKT